MTARLVGLISLLYWLLNAATGFGQVYVDGVAIDTVATPFIQIIGSNGGDLNRTSIIVDHGQRPVGLAFTRQRITGPDRKPITFKSTVDALNFFVKQGWELAFFDAGDANVYIYMLRRKGR